MNKKLYLLYAAAIIIILGILATVVDSLGRRYDSTPNNISIEKAASIDGEDVYILTDKNNDKEYLLIKSSENMVISPRIQK
jgi:hypothetical protein